ncbi:GNAT family N-acetyltransferase [Silicimonas algicola]|uniref:Acetyltransferase (GNAT) family protein n=1 Tax=Silicimonas algicola TaxID=1826607 RepID=A0A316G662_9RHOB|nr:GNAT family N-acetyltransferase [Silicimonas algicola]AZQ69376.1 GNAT family N-acetyltransferase [Silicimonas algicola]PWK56439.1 acetyltransferase (GNAT) family protein [Silicimonas algicola]
MTAPEIRVAGIEEVRAMLDWAEAEGWNPGLDDAEAFLAADPSGFFLAQVDGAPVAAISVVNHSDAFAFLGLYICRKDFRGQGIGFALWKHALEHAGSRTVGLDGVAAQEANYAKSGFVRSGATVRYEGCIEPLDAVTVRDLRPTDLAAILTLDADANGYSRTAFLAAWLTPTDLRKSVVLSSGAALRGFATIRRCHAGVKIGPIVAPDPEAAFALMRAVLLRLPSTRVIADVPSGNTAFSTLLTREGFSETFATARMYRGRDPVESDALRAIATMELG